MKMNLGIIGMGKLGRMRYDLLSELDEVGDISFYDPMVKEYQGVLGKSSVDEMFYDQSVGGVIVSVPNVYTKDYVERSLINGKHVLCEKPPGVSYEEALVLEELDTQHPQQILKFGFNHRYLSHFLDLKEIVQSNKYGQVLWVRGVYGKGYDNDLYNQWRSKRELAGGGILMDQGIHMIDLILELVGEAKVVQATIDNLKWKRADVEDNVFALLRSDNGVPISLHSSMVHWPHTFRLEVGMEEALVTIEGVKSSSRSYGDEQLQVHRDWRDSAVEVHSKKYNEIDYYTFRQEHEEWLGVMSGRCEVENGTAADAVRAMEVVSNIYSYAQDYVEDRKVTAA